MLFVRLPVLLRGQSQLLSESTLVLGQTLLGVEEVQVCYAHITFFLFNLLFFVYKCIRATEVSGKQNKVLFKTFTKYELNRMHNVCDQNSSCCVHWIYLCIVEGI